MTRPVAAMAFCGVLIGGVLLAADDDPVGTKLAAAKAEYAKDVEKARGLLVGELNKKAEAAQKGGDLKALEKIEEEIKALQEKGNLPKSVPTTVYEDDMQTAKAKLNDAYDAAVKGYVMDGKKATAKAVQAEWDDFKKGDAAAATGPSADDGFGVGTKLTGTYFRSWVDNGKKVGVGSDLEMAVTKRSGKEFTAEFWINKHKIGVEVEGAIDNGQVKWKVTKALTDDIPDNVVGNSAFTGHFEKGSLTGTVTRPKTPGSYRGEVKLKLSNE